MLKLKYLGCKTGINLSLDRLCKLTKTYQKIAHCLPNHIFVILIDFIYGCDKGSFQVFKRLWAAHVKNFPLEIGKKPVVTDTAIKNNMC